MFSIGKIQGPRIVRNPHMREYNILFQNMNKNTQAPYENFNGKRRITLYKGKTTMSKVTERLFPEGLRLRFTRCMENIGTKNEPELKDTKYVLDTKHGTITIWPKGAKTEINDPPQDVYTVNIVRHPILRLNPLWETFKSFDDIRKNPRVQDMLDYCMGRKPKELYEQLNWLDDVIDAILD